jgi:hypothetical protein
MFRDNINTTELTSAQADVMFKDLIPPAKYMPDQSLSATLRGLLYDKISQGEKFIATLYNWDYNAASSISSFVDDAYVASKSNKNMFLDIHYVRCGILEDEVKKLKLPDSFHQITKVTELFRRHFECYCFISEEIRSVVIVCRPLELKYFHFLQCALVGVMPWFFTADSIDEDRMELILSLKEKSSSKYIDTINKIAMKLDFYSEFVKQKLAGFENVYERQRVGTLEESIRSCNSEIDYLSGEMSKYIEKIRNFQYELAGIYEKINSGSEESEIMDYFLSNRHLELINATESQMTFVASDYLTYWDEDMAEKIIHNRNSYFYDVSSKLSKEDLHAVLNSIFIDREIKVKFCAAYKMELRNMTINPIQGYAYGSRYKNHLPNTHIDRYSCIGNFRRIFTECLQKQDYLGAIEQAIVSAKSLNLGDTTVMREFLRELFGFITPGTISPDRCIELPDGRMVNIVEAAEWLKERSAE